MSDPAAIPSPAEIELAVRGLEASRDALLSVCAPLTPEQWEATDGPGRWTVAQILEHLVIIERNAVRGQEKMLAQPAEPDWAARTADLTPTLPLTAVPRIKITAPPPLVPQGGIAPADLLEEFAAARAALIEFARRPGQPLKEHSREHPILGPVNAYQWLLLAGHHTQRHIVQIERCLAPERADAAVKRG